MPSCVEFVETPPSNICGHIDFQVSVDIHLDRCTRCKYLCCCKGTTQLALVCDEPSCLLQCVCHLFARVTRLRLALTKLNASARAMLLCCDHVRANCLPVRCRVSPQVSLAMLLQHCPSRGSSPRRCCAYVLTPSTVQCSCLSAICESLDPAPLKTVVTLEVEELGNAGHEKS